MAFGDNNTGGRTILDSGCGTEPQKVVLAEDCMVGDALGYSTGWKRALATVGTAIQTRVIALRAGKNGEEVPVSAKPTLGGFSGATPGSPVYQDEGTNYGGYTQTAPTTSGDVNKIIGYALSATVIAFDTMARADGTA